MAQNKNLFSTRNKLFMIAPGHDIHSLRPLNWLLNKRYRIFFSNRSNPFPKGQSDFKFIRFPYPIGGRLFPRLFGKIIGVWLFRRFEWLTTLRLKILFRQINPDIVHVHWIDDRAYFCALAGLHPLIFTAWGTDINQHFLPNADPVSKRRIGKALSKADIILSDSADILKKCTELAGKQCPTELITLGVNTDIFRPGYTQDALEWRRKLNIPDNTTVFLSIRGWSPLYRHESILKAFSMALPQLQSKAVLVFKILKRVNTDHIAYEIKMRELANKLNVQHFVRWMEEVPIDSLPGIYSFADVIINYPSIDAFPVTFLEAAACECPVISCRLPSYFGSFAEEYFTLVSTEDIAELSDAIVNFELDRGLHYKEGLRELRRMVCEQNDENIVAERLNNIYRNLLTFS